MKNKKKSEFLQDETLAKKLITKGFLGYFFMFVVTPIGYIIRIILSDDLAVSDIGLIYTLISFITLISVYNDFGITQSMKYFIPKYLFKKDYSGVNNSIFLSLIIQLITGSIIITIIVISKDFLTYHYFHDPRTNELLNYFCIYFILINIYQVISSFLISFQNILFERITELIKSMTMGIFCITIFFYGFGNIYTYSFTWILGLSIGIILGTIYIAYKYKYIFFNGKINLCKKDFFKKYITYSFWNFLGLNAGLLLGSIDQQMLIILKGPYYSGIYSNYLSLLNIVFLITGPIFILLVPIISELYTKGESWKMTLLQNIFYKYFSVFAICIGGLFFCLGDIIGIILFTTKFLLSGSLLIYSAPFLVLNILMVINFHILSGIGNVKYRVKIIFIGVILNFVLNLIMIPIIGIIGAIITTIIGRILMFYLSYKKITKINTITHDYKYLFKNIIYVVFFSFIIIIIKKDIFVINDISRFQNLINLIIIFIVYSSGIILINYKSIVILKNEILNLKSEKK